MIIRVFEGRLKPGSEQDFMAGERELLRRTDIDGLISASVGRRLVGGSSTHVITLSIWRDEAALRNFTDDISRPVFLSGHEGNVESWTVRHFDEMDAPA
jgi:heme-degrading monooxygenase HmoA